MSLSGILASTPKFKTTLPVSGKVVEYRPFVVKEEKILLMASETKEEKTINAAVKEVVRACTNGSVDPTELPVTDMEYLFLQLRSNSVGETAKPSVKCNNCNTPNEISIPINDIKAKFHSEHSKNIHIISDISVLMKYPNMNIIDSISGDNEIEKTFNLLIKCIDKVIQGETIYNASEMGFEEVRGFVEEMTQEQFKKLLNFIETMPKLEYQVNFKCKKCSVENDMVLKGMTNFFS